MRHLLLALFALLGAAATPALAQPRSQVEVEGTEFVATLADGRVLRSRNLVGTVFDVHFGGRPMRLRIAAVEPDPTDKSGTIWLHTLETVDADGRWTNLCSAGPDGRQQAFPLAGGPDGVELSCTSGAIGKCVRLGYRRWTAADGAALAPLHAACVRLVRADYGGVSRSWTRDGMRIDVYDDLGVQRADNAPGDVFEAGWSSAGAICVHHVRVGEKVTLDELETLYPALRGRTGAVCTEEFARAHGAVLFNRSKR